MSSHPLFGEDKSDAGTRSDGKSPLSADILALLCEQAIRPGRFASAGDVVRAFTSLLCRHFEYRFLYVFLSGHEDQPSHAYAAVESDIDGDSARAYAQGIADTVESERHEVLVKQGDASTGSGMGFESLDSPMRRFGASVCIGTPVRWGTEMIGRIVAATGSKEPDGDDIEGVRTIALPLAVALANARRNVALGDQSRRIERLVEQSERTGSDLEQANLELKRVARYRSLFLARMSHELRTPLTSMLGFTEILLDHEKLTEAQRRFCGKIRSSGLQLQTSLNQLVDLSRLEAGQTEIFLHEFSLRETLRESCQAVARLAHMKEVKLECCSTEETCSIVSDESKLRQVLYNFLAHAVHRSPEGGKVLTFAQQNSGTRLVIGIEDKGEHVAETAKIFEPVDVDAASHHATGISELGMTIARRLLDVLGGTVALESPKSGGLKVRIELPARPTGESS